MVLPAYLYLEKFRAVKRKQWEQEKHLCQGSILEGGVDTENGINQGDKVVLQNTLAGKSDWWGPISSINWRTIRVSELDRLKRAVCWIFNSKLTVGLIYVKITPLKIDAN